MPDAVKIHTNKLTHLKMLLANNLFKLLLVGRSADKKIVIKFGVPAVIASLLGAPLLAYVSLLPVIASYQLGGAPHEVTIVKLATGLIIIFFACFELIPRFANISISQKYLPFGGLLSGFFGGLSGNQGALRSIFLIKSQLDKKEFNSAIFFCFFYIVKSRKELIPKPSLKPGGDHLKLSY